MRGQRPCAEAEIKNLLPQKERRLFKRTLQRPQNIPSPAIPKARKQYAPRGRPLVEKIALRDIVPGRTFLESDRL